jgi:hypothetical protein
MTAMRPATVMHMNVIPMPVMISEAIADPSGT